MKRPIGVWLVTIYAVLNVLIGVLGVYLIASGKMRVNTTVSVVDIGIAVLMHISVGLGGASIFTLRKFAFPMFVAAATLALVQVIWHIFTHRFMVALGGPSPFAWIVEGVAWGVIISVISYTAHLSKKGILN